MDCIYHVRKRLSREQVKTGAHSTDFVHCSEMKKCTELSEMEINGVHRWTGLSFLRVLEFAVVSKLSYT